MTFYIICYIIETWFLDGRSKFQEGGIYILIKKLIIISSSIFILLGIFLTPVSAPISAVVEDNNSGPEGMVLSKIDQSVENIDDSATEIVKQEVDTTAEEESETEYTDNSEKNDILETEVTEEAKAIPQEESENEKLQQKSNTDSANSIFITQNEYETICCVVMREAGAGCFDGCAAVAQCILDGMLYEHKSASYVLSNYGYKPQGAISRARSIPVNERVRNAVSAVFYNGYRVTSEMIIVYYSPANMPNNWSTWHEQQVYVCSYDGNKFFKYPGT